MNFLVRGICVDFFYIYFPCIVSDLLFVKHLVKEGCIQMIYSPFKVVPIRVPENPDERLFALLKTIKEELGK